MNERSDNIEARMSRLRLRAISANLQQRIENDLAEPAPPRGNDRWLWSAITSGAIAACAIVATLISDARSGPARAPVPLTQQSEPSHSLNPALASADHRWGDELSSALYWSHP